MFPQSNLSYPDYLDWKRLNQRPGLARRLQPDGLPAEHRGRAPQPAGRPGERRLLPHPWRHARAGPRLPRRRGPARGAAHGPAQLRRLAGAVRREPGRPRPDRGPERRCPHVIIGVLPREFHFAPRGAGRVLDDRSTPKGGCDLRRSCHGLYGVGRLKDGVIGGGRAGRHEGHRAATRSPVSRLQPRPGRAPSSPWPR